MFDFSSLIPGLFSGAMGAPSMGQGALGQGALGSAAAGIAQPGLGGDMGNMGSALGGMQGSMPSMGGAPGLMNGSQVGAMGAGMPQSMVDNTLAGTPAGTPSASMQTPQQAMASQLMRGAFKPMMNQPLANPHQLGQSAAPRTMVGPGATARPLGMALQNYQG